ncbi:MAG: extracellular solute-binding protein [Clostridia bacterium]|nr:extracellular solute-binding protein [Clostridia bacterium]
MKLWKLLALIAALTLVFTATALAYDGEVLDITADSDDDPFTWDPDNDAMAAYIRDNFGINFIQSDINYYNNDFTQTQIAAADGNLPEVFTADILYYTQEITQFIPEELVAEIPQELIDKYPLTKERLENDAVSQLVHDMYGGYYFLPKPDSADPTIYKAERKGLFIRKDWLEKLNLEMPTTWEELYEVAHAFTYGDPDGNGIDDTYGLTGDGLGTLRYFFASTGVSNRYWNKDADGNWFFGALDDRNITPLEWLRKMYEDKSLDPDFAATSWKEGLQKFSSNTFGICVRNADADWIHNVMVKYYGAANPDCNPFDRVSLIGALGNNKGDQSHMEAYISCMVAVQFAPEISEEKMDRFLAFYEYLLGEGKYMRLGLEGEDYTIEADGSVKLIRDAEGKASNLATKYPSIPATHWTSWGFEMQALPSVEYYDEYNDETKALKAVVCAIRNVEPLYPEVGPILIDDVAVTDASAFNITSEYWAIITGTEPVADMFHDMQFRAQAYYGPATEKVTEIAAQYGW